MNDLHFGDEIKRLVETWGQNAFGRERVGRIYSFVKDLPDQALTEIVNSLIDSSKFAPTPSAFNEAASLWKKDNGYFKINEDAYEPISCTDCYETGWMFCRLNEKEPLSLILCQCAFGHREQVKLEKLENISYVPRWEEKKFSNMGFVKFPFPYKMFIPNSEDQNGLFEAHSVQDLQSNDIVKRWQIKIRESIKYWHNLVHGRNIENGI